MQLLYDAPSASWSRRKGSIHFLQGPGGRIRAGHVGGRVHADLFLHGIRGDETETVKSPARSQWNMPSSALPRGQNHGQQHLPACIIPRTDETHAFRICSNRPFKHAGRSHTHNTRIESAPGDSHRSHRIPTRWQRHPDRGWWAC